MKAVKIVAVLFMAFICNGCSKELKTEEMMDFEAEEVMSLEVQVFSEEESEVLIVSSAEGIKEFIDLIQEIEIDKEAKEEAPAVAPYHDYVFHLENGEVIRYTDYLDKLKVTDEEGNITWYELDTNTWDSLTYLWVKYVDLSQDTKTLPGFEQNNIIPTTPIDEIKAKKPVIYLYPEEAIKVSVTLELNGELTFTYPSYQTGWEVIADPDGMLHNLKDNRSYSCLFWEGITDIEFDMSRGFVIKGSETTKFLEEKLTYLGLSEKERNEFIIYWAPLMTENPYNLISFQGTEYTENAKLTIFPEPDSVLRVFMVYQPLNEYIEYPQQELTEWKREGFAVVEWGGAQLD